MILAILLSVAMAVGFALLGALILTFAIPIAGAGLGLDLDPTFAQALALMIVCMVLFQKVSASVKR